MMPLRPRIVGVAALGNVWVEDGDMVRLDVPNRSLDMLVSDEEMEARRAA